MDISAYSIEGPTFEDIEIGASYHVRVPSTGEHWAIIKTANDCGIDSIEPLEVPDGWDDADEETASGSYALLHRFVWPY